MNINRERYNGICIGINVGDSARASDIKRIIQETKIVNALQTLVDIANSGFLHSFKLRLVMEEEDSDIQ